MILRQPILFLPSRICFSNPWYILIEPGRFPSQPRQAWSSTHHHRPRRRLYATVRDASPSSEQPDLLQWPESTTVPTPYQILHTSPRDRYTKHCFYKLVKIYHPDRNICCHEDQDVKHIRLLPGTVKLERYRLIVAAHEILSDPTRRRAYDRYGTGWEGRRKECVFTWRENMPGETRWSGFDANDSPMRNATWEDWERWYNRHKKPEPVYTSNGSFITLIAFVLLLGGFGQHLQVDRHQEFFNEQAEERHRMASQALLRHRQMGKEGGQIDDRVQDFLKARDDAGYGVAIEGEKKLLGEPVVCMSDGIQQKRQPNNKDGHG